jgi:fructosamine-3-kinase
VSFEGRPLGAVGDELPGRIAAATPVGGGSINSAWKVELESGQTLFVKARGDALPAEFVAEAAGLHWLADTDAIACPRVVGVGERHAWLALEWVERGGLVDEQRLGRELARLHRAGARAHGALPPDSPDALLRIGSVELAAAEHSDWAELYAEQRLLPLLRMARERDSISNEDGASVERVCEQIAELTGPPEPPSRLHGDLWSGNLLSGPDGRPFLIDPAAHGGHREIDLAMLRLFGGPGPAAYAAYHEAFPLADGHEERVELWQLLPLLVHAVLFGGGYGASAGRAARHYL